MDPLLWLEASRRSRSLFSVSPNPTKLTLPVRTLSLAISPPRLVANEGLPFFSLSLPIIRFFLLKSTPRYTRMQIPPLQFFPSPIEEPCQAILFFRTLPLSALSPLLPARSPFPDPVVVPPSRSFFCLNFPFTAPSQVWLCCLLDYDSNRM